MKKVTHIFTAAALTLMSFNSIAQKEEEKIDTVKIELGETTVFIITDDDLKDSTFIDAIGDLNKSNKSAQDYAWSGIDGFQIGAIGLFTSDGKRAFADRPDLALNSTRCSMLGFTPIGKEAEIIKDRLRLAAGLGFQFESYAFDKNVRLTDEPYLQGIEDTVRDYRKNTLNANYVTLPVVLQFNTKRNLEKPLHIAVGAIAGYRIGSNMTYKWSEDGRRQRERLRNDYALEPYRLSAIAQIGIGNATIWAQYDLTMKFTATDTSIALVGAKGTPEVYAWSAGINIPFGEY
ncbi:MAG: hypothetical protein ACK478_09635 [Flavobacteriales bacterium]|jgi:hypothetical protein